MIDGDLFDLISDIAVDIRGDNTRPFGGIQLIATGDFFQVRPFGVPFVPG